MYVCTKCKSDQVEALQWIDLNTGEADHESDTGEFYCRSCGAHTDVEYKKSIWEDEETPATEKQNSDEE